MDELQKMFKVLADKNRLRMLRMLRQRDLCVCELAHILGISQPAVSKHIRKFKEMGWLGARQSGFWTEYFLTPQAVEMTDMITGMPGFKRRDAQWREDLRRVKSIDRAKICNGRTEKESADVRKQCF